MLRKILYGFILGVIFCDPAFALSTLIKDGFSGTNGTGLSGRTPDTTSNGNLWVLSGTAANTYQIQSHAAVTTGTGNHTWFATVDATQADVTILEDYTTGASQWNGALIFNYVDANNYWMLDVPSLSGKATELHKIISGVDTSINTEGSTIANNTLVHLKVVTSGDTITCYRNGTQTMTNTIVSRQLKTATIHGMRQADAFAFISPAWDSFEVDGTSAAFNDPLWFGMRY